MTGFVRRTGRAVRLALGDRRGRAVAVGVTVLYLLGYLTAIGMLRLGGDGVGLRVAADPTRRLFQQTFGSFTYELVALVRLGVVTYQFSLNTVIGLVVGLLVGVNVAVSEFAWRQPSACGVGTSSAGLLAGIPALLSGTACCAPVIVLLVGIQVTGALLVVFELLVPISVALLVGSLLAVGQRVDQEPV